MFPLSPRIASGFSGILEALRAKSDKAATFSASRADSAVSGRVVDPVLLVAGHTAGRPDRGGICTVAKPLDDLRAVLGNYFLHLWCQCSFRSPVPQAITIQEESNLTRGEIGQQLVECHMARSEKNVPWAS